MIRGAHLANVNDWAKSNPIEVRRSLVDPKDIVLTQGVNRVYIDRSQLDELVRVLADASDRRFDVV